MSYLIVDNGAGTIKYGSETDTCPQEMANVTARVNKSMQYLIGNQVVDFQNGSALQFIRPFDRGYLNNMQCEIDVFTKIFDSRKSELKDAAEKSLFLTEAPLNLPTIQSDTNEVVFEYFGFQNFLRRSSAFCSNYEYVRTSPPYSSSPLSSSSSSSSSCCVVVDSGFSFSHAIPFIDSSMKTHAIKRVNVGGKLLTNYLKEVVSYRQWNMMDEFLLINQVKEELSYISKDFLTELQSAKQSAAQRRSRPLLDTNGQLLKKFFVLPDFHHVMKGYVKEDQMTSSSSISSSTSSGSSSGKNKSNINSGSSKGDSSSQHQQQQQQHTGNASDQVLSLDIERFTVPEVLFRPSDIGIDQAGIAEATWQSLSSLNQVEMGLAAQKILLVGGNMKIPNMKERFQTELRSFVPDIFSMEVILPENPQFYSWHGGAHYVGDLRAQGRLEELAVSRQEYLEKGQHYCNYKLNKC